MSAKNINNNNKQQVHSNSCEPNIFGMDMDIKDDFIDPFDNLEKKMFGNFKNSLKDLELLSGEEQDPRNEPKEQPQRKNNNGTYISRVYCRNEGHNISEAREAYKNSDGVMKSAYQRGLDEKGARFIKEKNTKTGKHSEHKVLKGIKENEIEGFNKEYNAYSNKCGFKKNYKALREFGPSMNKNVRQIAN